MNIRCAFCQTPYSLSRVQMLDALQEVDAGKLSHYDAQCPRCRRATRIPKLKLEMAMPRWRDELKQFEVDMKEHPQHEAPLAKPEAEEPAATKSAPASEPAPAKKSTKAAAPKEKAVAAESKSIAKKQAAKKSK